MNLNFINLGRAFFGLLAELACDVKSLNRKYKLANRLRGPWPKGPFLWLHGASMGECKMLLNLAEALQNDVTNLPKILITCQKPEVVLHLRYSLMQGSVAESACCRTEVTLAPADVPWVLKKFFRRVRPVGLILGENELWPGYLSGTLSFLRRPSVALVSGRFKSAFPGMNFSGLGFATMQTAADQSRFLKFAAQSFRAPISVGGNWKLLPWAREKNSVSAEISSEDKSVDFALISVHVEEMPALTKLIIAICNQGKSVVLAPRRLEECSAIRSKLLNHGVKVVDYPEVGSGAVALVDVFGAVGEILLQSKSALVGGSFHKSLGVHDFWEPLRMGVPAFVGPFCHGHESSVNQLVREGALVRLQRPLDLFRQKPVDGARVIAVLSQEREKILNSYTQLKKFVEELLE